jgi:serine/threonine protein kinase
MSVKIKVGKGLPKTIHEICLNGYELEKFLANGAFGSVYQACDADGDCNYVVKIQELEYGLSLWEREVKMSKLLNEYEIGPKFIGAWHCKDDNIGMIVCELWDERLPRDECLPDDLVDKIDDQVRILGKLGLVHGDILPKNILIKRDENGEIVDATITDFGSVMTIEAWLQNQITDDTIKTFYEYQNHRKNETRIFYSDNNITLEEVIEDPTLLDASLVYFLKNCIKEI